MGPTGGSDVCTMGKLLRRRTPELTGVKSERGVRQKKNRGRCQKEMRVARGDDFFRL
jgi:hypothetical protein